MRDSTFYGKDRIPYSCNKVDFPDFCWAIMWFSPWKDFGPLPIMILDWYSSNDDEMDRFSRFD